MPRHDELYVRNRIEKLILWHLWACAPFAVPWMLFPEFFGRDNESVEHVASMRWLFAAIGASLLIRTWVVFKRVPGPWTYFWPLLDVTFITLGARFDNAGPDSWVVLLYMLPVLQAAATLDVRWSIGVATLGSLALALMHGLENLRYSYFLFSLALLILAASLVTRLARGLVRVRSRLEVAQYRSDLAAEMHDGLQQYLAAIATRLEYAESLAATDVEKACETAGSAKGIARQASDELRLMLHRLRSPLLEKSSFEEALRFLAALFSERSPLAVEVHIEGKPLPLSPRQEHAFLRIVQEALTNVVKHAHASRAEIGVVYGADDVKVFVADDGEGISDSSAKGIGMETMRNRAEGIGSTFSVHAIEGEGTRVEVLLRSIASAIGSRSASTP